MVSRFPASSSAARSSSAGADPGAEVVEQLRIIFTLVKSQFRELERKSGLAGAQVWALSMIASSQSIGVSALANAMGIHQSTASNLLKPLMEDGLVAATRSDDDRRALHLKVTAKGKRQLAKAPTAFTGVLADAVGRLDEATRRRMKRDLSELARVLEGGVPPVRRARSAAAKAAPAARKGDDRGIHLVAGRKKS